QPCILSPSNRFSICSRSTSKKLKSNSPTRSKKKMPGIAGHFLWLVFVVPLLDILQNWVALAIVPQRNVFFPWVFTLFSSVSNKIIHFDVDPLLFRRLLHAIPF